MKRKKRQSIFVNVGDIIVLNEKQIMIKKNGKHVITNICESCFSESCNRHAIIISRYKDKESMNYKLQIFFCCTGKIVTKNDGNFRVICNAKI